MLIHDRISAPLSASVAIPPNLQERSRRTLRGRRRRLVGRPGMAPAVRQGQLDFDSVQLQCLPIPRLAMQPERKLGEGVKPLAGIDSSPIRPGGSEVDLNPTLDHSWTGAAAVPHGQRLQSWPHEPSVDMDLQGTWWRIEDILARLAMICPISVDQPNGCGEPSRVTVHGLKQMNHAGLTALRTAALDADSYQCWRDGRPLAFVQTLGWHGDDLMLCFTPLAALQRWEEGAEMVWQVRGYLARMEQRSGNISGG